MHLTDYSLGTLLPELWLDAASGGGKPSKELKSLLWVYIFAAAIVGSKVKYPLHGFILCAQLFGKTDSQCKASDGRSHSIQRQMAGC